MASTPRPYRLDCSHCGETFAAARRDAKTCSTRCRVAAHRARQTIPGELRRRDRWVRHVRKRPVTVDGEPASTADPATWTDYRTARDSETGDGLGFVLDGDGVVCLDLDHCLEDGQLAPWAADLLDRCPDTYVEVSPSGDGLHIWGTGHVPRGRRRQRPGGAVEVYGTGRYITVTGDHYRGPSTLADLSDVAAGLLAEAL